MEPAMGNHGAEAFVDTLNDLGVDNIFLNPGIDLVPLMATIARYRAGAKKAPRVILCTDESVAVSAAHGSAMVSGKPQVVAVFEDVGTLQGGGALVNLKYGRIPVVICAGSNRTPKRTDWLGQPADQRKILRDYVKWDHEITTEEDVSTVVREAVRIASTEPCGPVYLSLGPDVLAGADRFTGRLRSCASFASSRSTGGFDASRPRRPGLDRFPGSPYHDRLCRPPHRNRGSVDRTRGNARGPGSSLRISG